VRLNLGCGREYRPGWINVDNDPTVEPDLLFDLNSPIWPFEDNSADFILLKFVLEHVGQSTEVFNGIMRELYRIAKPDTVLEIHSRHPQHSDFFDDPTCVRKITPEVLAFYDMGVGEDWRATKKPKRSLTPVLKVDFETVEALYNLDMQLAERGVTAGQSIAELARTSNNVIQSTTIKLQARKPFKFGRSLQRYGAICLERHVGMGDVLMTLAAANALKQISGKPVYLITSDAMRPLAEASPVLAGVITDANVAAGLDEQYRDTGGVLRADFAPALFGLSRLHQIDAFLEHFGQMAPASAKEIVLRDPNEEAHARFAESLPPPAAGRKRVLVHAATGDVNRTWPADKWGELCERLSREGHQVVLIGASTLLTHRGIHKIEADNVVDATEQINLLETLALMRRSDVLVSTDSGPVQLAGATDIHIVSIYSVSSGRQRLPYRHGTPAWRTTALAPSCSFTPCYQYIHDMEYVRKAGPITLLRMYADWCINPEKYRCMTDEITVDIVYAAVLDVLAEAPVGEPAATE
jgi:ADP-heptose:LPS heptosyltransferase